MFHIGQQVILNVHEANPLYDMNGKRGVIYNMTKDVHGYTLYDVDIQGRAVLVFEEELTVVKEVE